MKILPKLVPVIVSAIALSACTGPSTEPLTGAFGCSDFMESISIEDYLVPPDLSDITDMANRGLLPQFFTAPLTSLKDRERSADGKIEMNILVLSGGGQWGSYGAGYLNGWSKMERVLEEKGLTQSHPPWMKRGDVDIITGISTGALQSTLAFVGINPELREAADKKLASEYRPARKEDVIIEKGLFWSIIKGDNGSFDPAPLEQSMREMIRDFGPAIVNDVPDNRRLVTGLVNLRTGNLHLADMRGALKEHLKPNAEKGKKKCFGELLMGSAAVPGTFSPRFIDGDMYVDGGVRLGLFLPLFWESLAYEVTANNLNPKDVRVKIMAIVNGSLSANDNVECDMVEGMCKNVKNKIFPIIKRSIGVLQDTNYNFSTFAVQENARRLGFEVEFHMAYASLAIVKLGTCKKGGSFNPAFMKCLYQLGFDDGKNFIQRSPFVNN